MEENAWVGRLKRPHREERDESMREGTGGETGPVPEVHVQCHRVSSEKTFPKGQSQEKHSGGPPTKCPK